MNASDDTTSTTRKPGKRRLGRGLGSLISSSEEEDSTEGAERKFFDCPLDQIEPMHGQPRKEFDPDALEELAQSIRESGLIQPLVVRKIEDNRFGLVAGERRWRAAQIAGYDHVPVVVREVSDNDAFVLALIENVQREDLNPIEEASAYQQLLDNPELTQSDVASRVGKSRVSIANALRLLTLNSNVQSMVADGTLSAGHARAVLRLPEHIQAEVADRIIRNSLTVRQAEALARKLLEPEDETKEAEDNNAASTDDTSDDMHTAQVRHVEKRLRERLSAKVRIKRKADHSGVIEISFADLDGLNGVIDELLNR